MIHDLYLPPEAVRPGMIKVSFGERVTEGPFVDHQRPAPRWALRYESGHTGCYALEGDRLRVFAAEGGRPLGVVPVDVGNVVVGDRLYRRGISPWGVTRTWLGHVVVADGRGYLVIQRTRDGTRWPYRFRPGAQLLRVVVGEVGR